MTLRLGAATGGGELPLATRAWAASSAALPWWSEEEAIVYMAVQACTRRSSRHEANQDRATIGSQVLATTSDVERSVLRPPASVAVLDGVGGAPAGELASDLAARTISAAEPPGDEQAATRLLERADQLLLDAGQAELTRRGMATTAAVLSLSDDGGAAVTANVGDSLVAHLDADGLHAVSVSDRLGGHTIYQSLGGHTDHIVPHASTLELVVGDRLLLATDGLTDVVAPSASAALIRDGGSDAATRLLEMVEAAGTPDDVTIVIVDICAD